MQRVQLPLPLHFSHGSFGMIKFTFSPRPSHRAQLPVPSQAGHVATVDPPCSPWLVAVADHKQPARL
jgi:hypothetical protein